MQVLAHRAAKPTTGVVTLLALLVGLVAFAPAAFAHHANVAPATSVVCDAGVIELRYTATSWVNGSGVTDTGGSAAAWRGLNPDVRVELSINGGAFTQIASHAFTASAGFPTFSGSVDLPASTTGSVRVRMRPVGLWGPSSTGQTEAPTGSDVRTSNPITVPTGCSVPATPGASARVDCATGVVVTLTNNPGAAANQVKATANLRVQVGSYDQVHTVTPGETETFTIPFATAGLAENGSASVVVTGTSGTTFSSTLPVSRDCSDDAEPSATATKICAASNGPGGVVRIVLTNGADAGGESVVFTVARTGGATTTHEVVAGASVTVDVTVAEDGDAAGSISAPGMTTVTYSENFNCQTPAPTASFVECATGGVQANLANTGTQGVTLEVLSNGVVVHTVAVAAGSSTTRLVTVAEDSAYDIVVRVQGGAQVNAVSGTRDCDEPTPTLAISNECAAAGVRVILGNVAGDDEAVFTVSGLAGTTTVPAGGSTSVVVPVAEGASYSITATVAGGYPVTGGPLTGTRDCTNPQFGTVVCSTSQGVSGVTVTLTNDGELAASVTISGAPGAVVPNPVSVPAGGSTTAFVAQTEDSAGFTLTGASTGNSPITVAVPARDCDVPAPTFDLGSECAEGGVSVTLGNLEGDDEAVFTVSGLAGTTTVPAGTSTTVVVPVAEGAAYTITATVAGGYAVDGGPVTGTRDCQEPTLVDVYECTEGGVTVRIGNEGTETVTVTVPGATDEEQDIPGGETRDFLIPQDEGDEGGTVTVDTGEGNEDFDVTYPERDCVEPGVPEISYECSEDEVVFTLTNTGDLPATFTVTVTGPDGSVGIEVGGLADADGVVTVGGGSSAEISFPVEENGTYEVTVAEPTIDTVTQQIIVDCVEPSAEITYECSSEGIDVTLTNEGDEGDDPTVHTITVNDEPFGETITVEPGDSTTVTIPVEENGTYDVVVTEETEGTVAEEEILVDCVEVAGTITEHECGVDEVIVTLTNVGEPGDEPAVFTVEVNGEPVGDPTSLEPGDSTTISIPVEENGTYDIVVSEATEGTVTEDTFTVNCETDFVDVGVLGVCDGDAPTIAWDLELDRPVEPGSVTIQFLDAQGNVRSSITGLDLRDSALWPGAIVDADGDPIDWPGWIFQGGQWVQGDDGFLWARPTVGVRFVINPTSDVLTLRYPDPSPTCPSGPPAEVEGTQTPRTPTQVLGTQLPRTGSDALSMLPLAMGLALAGFGLTVFASERRRMLQAIQLSSGASKY